MTDARLLAEIAAALSRIADTVWTPMSRIGVPASTTRPRLITITWSQIWLATRRSWVMKIMARCFSACTSASN